MEGLFENADMIHVVTRKDLLTAGDLVDVTEMASQLFKIPVAVTRRVWEGVITPPPAVAAWQDQNGRLWDVLWMCMMGGQKHAGDNEFLYPMIVVNKANDEDGDGEEIQLKAIVSAADPSGAPCLTILMPDED